MEDLKTIKQIPWGIKHTNAPQLWNETEGENVIVAVLDSGCDINHPDLKGQILDGRNFTSDYNRNPKNYHDNLGHGTHVAGIIAGNKTETGIIGMAPKSKLIIGKVASGNGRVLYGDITAGIEWATKWRSSEGKKVNVISMSLGGPHDTKQMHNAVKKAISENIIIICASGNNGNGEGKINRYMYPASYPEVIEVGAIDENENVLKFSNANHFIDCVAPGKDILSCLPNEKWGTMSGTSMAAPHVSGAMALLISYHEKNNIVLNEQNAYELLLDNLKKSDLPKNLIGNGIIDLSNLNQVEKANSVSFEVCCENDLYYIKIGSYQTKEEANLQLNKLIKG